MLKLLAIIARVHADLNSVSDLSVNGNVCAFTHTELHPFRIAVTLLDDGKVTEYVDGDVRTFDSLDEYDTYLTELMTE